MSVTTGYIQHALNQELEQSAWDLWTSIYPSMTTGHVKFMSFLEFKEKLYQPKQEPSDKSVEEIEEEMAAVMAAYEGR